MKTIGKDELFFCYVIMNSEGELCFQITASDKFDEFTISTNKRIIHSPSEVIESEQESYGYFGGKFVYVKYIYKLSEGEMIHNDFEPAIKGSFDKDLYWWLGKRADSSVKTQKEFEEWKRFRNFK